jgi:hypothetical protein
MQGLEVVTVKLNDLALVDSLGVVLYDVVVDGAGLPEIHPIVQRDGSEVHIESH